MGNADPNAAPGAAAAPPRPPPASAATSSRQCLLVRKGAGSPSVCRVLRSPLRAPSLFLAAGNGEDTARRLHGGDAGGVW